MEGSALVSEAQEHGQVSPSPFAPRAQSGMSARGDSSQDLEKSKMDHGSLDSLWKTTLMQQGWSSHAAALYSWHYTKDL